ncbi:hypothetical protein B6N58_08650 [Legionella micdadei]|nr:hypothetical protein B6N58_08650 [Legionella micdadei]
MITYRDIHMEKRLYKYLVWFIVTLYVVYAFSLNTAAAVFSNAIKATLGASDLQASLATGAFILGFACMQIPAGYLLDKFNAKYIVSLGVFLLAAGNCVTSISTNLFLFTLSNLLQGIGASFSFVAAAVLIAQWFKENNFPILFGLTQTLSCIFAGILHYYFIVALESYSWGFIFKELAISGFILFVLVLVFVKSPAGYVNKKPISFNQSLSLTLGNRQILLCSVAAAASFGVLLAYAGFWYSSVRAFYSVDKLDAAITSGVIFVGIGIGTPLLGWFSNLAKSRVMVIHLSLVLGTMALLLDLYLPHFQINTLIFTEITSFLTGFFLSGSMLFYTVVSEIADNQTRGVAISLLNTSVFLFNTLMLFIPYLFITAISKQFFTYLWVLPFSTMFSILIVYFISEPKILGENSKISA